MKSKKRNPKQGRADVPVRQGGAAGADESQQSAIRNPQSAITYIERADHQSHAAMAVRIESDAARYKDFCAEGKQLEEHTVRAANIGRELGLSFQEYWLPPDRASAENYFNQHYRKPLGLTFAVFNWLIAASKKLPENCRTMEDVLPAIQLTFFAGGLIAPPEGRAVEQESHETTPTQMFWHHLSRTRLELGKALENAGKWDAATKADIRKTLDEHKHWLEEAEKKIA